MEWKIPNIWAGEDCWIIGGGPSISKQFNIPTDVVKQVALGQLAPEAFSTHMLAIHNKHVIGVNAAYMLGNWLDILFFGDVGFFLEHEKGIASFPGIKISGNEQAQRDWVRYCPKDMEKIHGITTRPNHLSWNGNSGAAAINLAVHLGATRIFLLGFDMNLNEESHQHWHNVYGRNTNKRAPAKLPFNRHLVGFPKIAEDARNLGIEIINVNSDSAINCFPKISLNQIL